MNSAAFASLGVFVLAYALILSGRLSQTLAALLGAVAMLLVGVAFGFYSPTMWPRSSMWTPSGFFPG